MVASTSITQPFAGRRVDRERVERGGRRVLSKLSWGGRGSWLLRVSRFSLILLFAFGSLMAGEAVGGSLSQWAGNAVASSEYSTAHWSALQATGAPNSTGCGGSITAWAPSSSGPDPEWIELSYDVPVYASRVRVHESHNSGFVYQVDLVDVNGGRHTIWSGTDSTGCPGWLELSFPQTGYRVNGVRIQAQVFGWEGIDAVELTGETGPGLEVTLTGCTLCRPGDPFTVDIRLTNPASESKPVEVKIGMRLPGGVPQNLFGKNLELVLPAEMDQTISSVFSIVLPSGMAAGEWRFEGALLEPELGETYSRDSKPFTVSVNP